MAFDSMGCKSYTRFRKETTERSLVRGAQLNSSQKYKDFSVKIQLRLCIVNALHANESGGQGS